MNDNAPLLGPALPAIVRAAADARCPVSPGSSPVAEQLCVSSLICSAQPLGVDRMTSWLRTYGSVLLCPLLCCLVVSVCAEASSTGE